MNKLQSDLIASWVEGQAVGLSSVTGVQVDSRLIEPGDLFIALDGDRVDGHDFMDKAISNGASLAIVSNNQDYSIPVIRVTDTMDALQKLAVAYRKTLPGFFIGVTGSNGKTSVKDALESVLSLVGPTIATLENMNTEIGTYLNLFRMTFETQFGIFEMGLDIRGDVSLLAEFIQPDAGIITSLAPAHLSNFDSVEEIAFEKMALLKSLEYPEFGFYQGDFELYRKLAKDSYISFGFEETNDLVVKAVNLNNEGISFTLGDFSYESNLLGRHQASNLAGVIGCLKAMGIDQILIEDGLKHVQLTRLRNQIVKHRQATILLDAYKSNPDSLTYALEVLEHMETQTTKSVILSEMVELGAVSHQSHIDMLNILAKMPLKNIYLLGNGFKLAINESKIDAKQVHVFDTYEELYKAVQPLFDQDGLILIKGARSYALEGLLEGDK